MFYLDVVLVIMRKNNEERVACVVGSFKREGGMCSGKF